MITCLAFVYSPVSTSVALAVFVTELAIRTMRRYTRLTFLSILKSSIATILVNSWWSRWTLGGSANYAAAVAATVTISVASCRLSLIIALFTIVYSTITTPYTKALVTTVLAIRTGWFNSRLAFFIKINNCIAAKRIRTGRNALAVAGTVSILILDTSSRFGRIIT